MLRRLGLGKRRMRIPRQQYPKLIEMEYGKAMISVIDSTRSLFAPLEHELPRLLSQAADARRIDADEPGRAREMIAKVREQIEGSFGAGRVEQLARMFAERTQTHQRVQLSRQVSAALGADVFASDKRIPTLVDHFVQENAALIKSVPRDLIDHVEKVTTRAFTTGTTSANLAEELQQRFDMSERHARLIARDQVGKLYGQTNAYRQQDLGIESFIWRTVGDERVRDEHEELDGEEFSYDDPPEEGLPGEPIQCRCYAEPVFKPLEEEIADESDNIPSNARDIEDEDQVHTLDPADILERGYYEPELGLDPGKYQKGLRSLSEGQRDPVKLVVGTNGRIELDDGRHRLRAAIETGTPVKVKFLKGGASTGNGAGIIKVGGPGAPKPAVPVKQVHGTYQPR